MCFKDAGEQVVPLLGNPVVLHLVGDGDLLLSGFFTI